MIVGLWTKTPDKVVGCKKVIDNLKKGFDQLGQEYVENKLGDVNACIHGGVEAFQKKTLPPDTLIGPEIVVLPPQTDAWAKYKNWTLPAQWVVNYMKEFGECRYTNFYLWPAGIDTDEFKPEKKDIQYDCFIYYKNVTRQTPIEKLNTVKHRLYKMGLKYAVLEYGNYQEEEMKELCRTSRFAIFLTGTESQGIAIMEVMAMGVPIYVIEEPVFKYSNYEYIGASAAPYFDNRCGVIEKDINNIGNFIKNMVQYKPQEYIQENHTCEISARKYIEILKKSHGV